MSTAAIGRYRLLRDLGQGAAAHVYLARDPSSGRQVAVKLLAAAYTTDPAFPEEFERTLATLKALDHPYLVPTVDFGSEDEQFFVVQRYMPGGTLADRLDGRPMLLSEALVVLERLAAALDAAHGAGLLHGDFNPAHVLYDINGRAYIVDLGLAPLLHGASEATQPGLPGLLGVNTPSAWERLVTPAYMSPEQAAGEAIDGRTDVYALGVLLFEMLTGRQPFVAVTPEGVVRQQVEERVPQLSTADLAQLVLPEEFNQVMARALAKDRDLRYPTAGVLAEAMRSMFLAPSAASLEIEQVATAPADGEPAEATKADEGPLAPPPVVVFEPAGREPVEILREEPVAEPRAAPGWLGLGLGGAGVLLVVLLLALARWVNVGGWGLAPTATATPTASATATFTATAAPSDTPTTVPSATPTPSPEPTATRTPRPTRTATASASPTPTRTRAPTQPPFTATPTSTLAGAAPLPLPATATP